MYICKVRGYRYWYCVVKTSLRKLHNKGSVIKLTSKSLRSEIAHQRKCIVGEDCSITSNDHTGQISTDHPVQYCCCLWSWSIHRLLGRPGQRLQPCFGRWLSEMVFSILQNSSWPLHDDFANHPPARLKSRRPIWSVDTTGVTDDLWRDAWVSASVVNHGLVPDPAVRPPGFDLPRQPWTLLNRFRTGHSICRASLHR